MMAFEIIDAAPGPAGIAIVFAAILIVIGAIVALAAGLVVFLWYRKRSFRHQEIGSPDQNSQRAFK
jgi:hypothetical protein